MPRFLLKIKNWTNKKCPIWCLANYFSDHSVLFIRNVEKSHTLHTDVTIKHFNGTKIKLRYLLVHRFIKWLMNWRLLFELLDQDIAFGLRRTGTVMSDGPTGIRGAKILDKNNRRDNTELHEATIFQFGSFFQPQNIQIKNALDRQNWSKI